MGGRGMRVSRIAEGIDAKKSAAISSVHRIFRACIASLGLLAATLAGAAEPLKPEAIYVQRRLVFPTLVDP